jgi:hypothetical protein
MAVSEDEAGTVPRQESREYRRFRTSVRGLTRPAVGLAAVVVFQLLFASVFVGVLRHPVLHGAPVAVAGRSPLAQVVSSYGGGTIRLVAEPTAATHDFHEIVDGRPAPITWRTGLTSMNT